MRGVRLMACSILAALLAAGCASAPTRLYTIRGPDSFHGPIQSETARAWMQHRGIHDYVEYRPTTIAFKYGTEEIRTLSYPEFDAFLLSRLAGSTVSSARRPDYTSSAGAAMAAVVYFSEDGHFARWNGPGRLSVMVELGRWWFEDVPEDELAKARKLVATPPLRMMCYDTDTVQGYAFDDPPRCFDIYGQLLGIHGEQSGDVFNLMSGKPPGVLKPGYPTAWPDGHPLFPEKAPHD